MNAPAQRRTFLDAMNGLRALLTEPRHLAGGDINGRCHDLPPVLSSESGSHTSSRGRAGYEGERTTCSPRSPSHRITEREARVVLADLVEAMTRQDRAKTVAAILSARFTDDELEWLSNQLGRVSHERKRA